MRRMKVPPGSRVSTKTQEKKLDYPLLLGILFLVGFGLMMVYDASVIQAHKDFGDKYFYIKQQLIWVILGLTGLTFFSFFNYHNFKKIAFVIFILSLLLLIAVLIPGFGTAAGGAHRWLKIGNLTIQPAEIIKLTTIIFLATLFEKRARPLPFAIIVFLISLIIGLFQKDLGTTIVFFLTSLAMFLVAGANVFYFIALIPMSFIGFWLFVISSSYRKQRILAFLDPFADPQGFSYHISQVLMAIGSGGIFGLGLGQSRQKFEYIPEVTTDSIFAIVGEEFGFIGSLILIGLIAFIIYRGFYIAINAEDNFGKLLAFGITFWLAIQSSINLGAMVALIPLTGVPLPFISYGGSALLSNLVAIGILFNISKSAKAP